MAERAHKVFSFMGRWWYVWFMTWNVLRAAFSPHPWRAVRREVVAQIFIWIFIGVGIALVTWIGITVSDYRRQIRLMGRSNAHWDFKKTTREWYKAMLDTLLPRKGEE